MPTHRPVRPAPGASTTLPRVQDEAVQRALDAIDLRFKQIAERIALFTATRPGVVPASGDDPDAVLHADGTWSPASGSGSGLVFDTILTPAVITFGPAYDNWNPGTLGDRTLILCTTDAATRAVRGMVGGVDGKLVTLLNINPNPLHLVNYEHENGSASAANRFFNAGGAAMSGNTGGAVTYYYLGSGLTGRWRHFGGTQ